MPELDKGLLLEILEGVAPGGGTAEHEKDDASFFRNFLPIPSYRFVLEADTLLILGGRGAGKTELFRLLSRQAGRNLLVKHAFVRSLPPINSTIWIAAFGRALQQEKTFPTPESVERLMARVKGTDWRAFWIGLILGVTLRQTAADVQPEWAGEMSAELRRHL